MIDIHAHILPGVDDGAFDMECAVEMASLAFESGVEIIVATPHSSAYGNQNLWGPELKKAIIDFRQRLKEEKIRVLIIPGMEIFASSSVPQLLKEKKLIGLNGSRYPLIEFEFENYAAQATEILEEIIQQGMRPVIAHPERYLYVQEDPTLLNLWVDMGCLLQINKGSLLGRFGYEEQMLALELVRRGFAFVVASDAHSSSIRTTWMSDVKELLKEEFSSSAAQALLEDNPLKLLKNQEIEWMEPEWF